MASTNPLVSIWIPVYNGAHLISKALESCIHQTYKNIEVIVFDDASTDSTGRVVAEYVGRDTRVKYFKTEKNLGQNKSYPKILERCSGELSLFLCADDWISRNYIEEAVEIFTDDPGTGAVTSRVWSVSEKGGRYSFSREPEVKTGRYARRWFGRNAYRNFITSMLILGVVRTKDALRAAYRINEIVNNPPPELDNELKMLIQREYGGEFIFCAEVMAHYSHLHVPTSAILLKTELPEEHYVENKGSMKMRIKFKLWPHERTANGILKLHYFSRKLYDVSFKNDWKEYIPAMRIFFGQEAFATIVIEGIKRRFASSFFNWPNLTKGLDEFFSEYSLYEVASSLLLALPRVFIRMAGSLRRRIFRAPRQDIYKREYFLNREGHFLVSEK